MRYFKLFDFRLSILLFITLSIWLLINPSLDNIIEAYFIIGGWQLISMLIHEWNKWFISRNSTRRIYHLVSLACLIAIPFGFAWVLVFISPLMAGYYIFICGKELYVKMQRPLALLK